MTRYAVNNTDPGNTQLRVLLCHCLIDIQSTPNCLKTATGESLNSTVCICFTLNSMHIL